LHEDLGQHRDHAVAAREPVVIVELLEPVDVHVEECEVLVPRKARFDLFGDRRISREARERIHRTPFRSSGGPPRRPREELSAS